jgi:hypothetical protein
MMLLKSNTILCVPGGPGCMMPSLSLPVALILYERCSKMALRVIKCPGWLENVSQSAWRQQVG